VCQLFIKVCMNEWMNAYRSSLLIFHKHQNSCLVLWTTLWVSVVDDSEHDYFRRPCGLAECLSSEYRWPLNTIHIRHRVIEQPVASMDGRMMPRCAVIFACLGLIVSVAANQNNDGEKQVCYVIALQLPKPISCGKCQRISCNAVRVRYDRNLGEPCIFDPA